MNKSGAVKQHGQKEGFLNDPIFLLSIEEYEKYKDKIPQINCLWWLRSPGYCQPYASYVGKFDGFPARGCGVSSIERSVRPAVRYDLINSYSIGWIDALNFFYCGIAWRIIDKDIAIAKEPISIHRFDEKSNDYENSEIRKFLLDWHKKTKASV